MKDKDYIEELFSKALSEHQVSVRPELWNAIQSKLAASSVATTTSVASKALLIKGIVGISSIAAISVGTYFYLNKENTKTVEKQTVINKENKKSSKEEKEIQLTTTTFVPLEKQKTSKETIANNVEKVYQDENVIMNATKEQKDIIIEQKTTEKMPLAETTKEEVKKETNVIKNIQKEEVKQKEAVKEETSSITSTQSFVKPWNNTNVFTPNGDGINDVFFIETEKLKEFSISILDMNNNVVYVSEDPKFQWDGTNYRTGEKVLEGNYSYIIYAVGLNGEQIKHFNLLYITK